MYRHLLLLSALIVSTVNAGIIGTGGLATGYGAGPLIHGPAYTSYGTIGAIHSPAITKTIAFTAPTFTKTAFTAGPAFGVAGHGPSFTKTFGGQVGYAGYGPGYYAGGPTITKTITAGPIGLGHYSVGPNIGHLGYDGIGSHYAW